LLAKGEAYNKSAEGVGTLKAVKAIADREGLNMPICQALYRVVFENADIQSTIRGLFDRPLKKEFEKNS